MNRGALIEKARLDMRSVDRGIEKKRKEGRTSQRERRGWIEK